MSEASNAASSLSLTLALNLDTGQRVRRSRWLNARRTAGAWPAHAAGVRRTTDAGGRANYPRGSEPKGKVIHAAAPAAGTFKLALGVPEDPHQRRLAELLGIIGQAAHHLLSSNAFPMLLGRNVVSVKRAKAAKDHATVWITKSPISEASTADFRAKNQLQIGGELRKT
jgi:hypothetical protein